MRYLPLIFSAALFCAALARDGIDQWVSATEVPPLVAETSVEVTDRNGHLLRAYTIADGRWRLGVELDRVDKVYIDALVSYEDKRFFSHSGVDPLALARAAWQAARNGSIVSGGSTLTMQVARLLEDSGTGRWSGKIRQMRLALALERRLSKEEILTLYLNRAPFSGNLEGVRSASRAYFGKDPRRLTASEAALLVALPQAPEARRPDRYPDAAEAARNRVLARISGSNQAEIDVITAMADPIPDTRRPFPMVAAHLADRARAERPLATDHRLTIDLETQRRMEALAARGAQAAGREISVALIAFEHTTGEIVSSVGAPEFGAEARQGYVDMTRAIRSPGSTLKPLVYGLAFDAGLVHPETLIEDRPARFGTYAPQNFDGIFRGTLRVREALQLSLNLPVVALTEAIGPASLVAHLEKSGARPEVPGGAPGLAVALGGIGLTLEDLVRLYGAIARGGRALELHHRLDAAAEPKGAAVMGPAAAWHLGDILSGLTPPPGAPANGLAYKTGTSYGFRDAWAIGFDGRHVIGVWMGRPDGTPVPGAFGGETAAPLLFEAFARLKPALDRLPPPPAATLMVETARLPLPLRRFRGPRGMTASEEGGPNITFPPNGAELETISGAIHARVAEGAAPFTWLADGRPVLTGQHGREARIETQGPGFVTLSVIDAKGRASRTTVFLGEAPS